MEKPFKEALDVALKVTKKSLRSVALSAGVSYDQLKSLMQGKSQTTNVDDGFKVAAAFGVSVEDFFAGNFSDLPTSVAVAGHVGAGAMMVAGIWPSLDRAVMAPSAGVIPRRAAGQIRAAIGYHPIDTCLSPPPQRYSSICGNEIG